MKVKYYLHDGANWQAQCVLAYLRSHLNQLNHELEVTRYDNLREQGYIFFMRIENRQMNVAVYEHRNTDTLCIVSFEKTTPNDPLSTEVWENMKDKWDITSSFDCGEIYDCSRTIIDIFQDFEESTE